MGGWVGGWVDYLAEHGRVFEVVAAGEEDVKRGETFGWVGEGEGHGVWVYHLRFDGREGVGGWVGGWVGGRGKERCGDTMYVLQSSTHPPTLPTLQQSARARIKLSSKSVRCVSQS